MNASPDKPCESDALYLVVTPEPSICEQRYCLDNIESTLSDTQADLDRLSQQVTALYEETWELTRRIGMAKEASTLPASECRPPTSLARAQPSQHDIMRAL